MDCDVLAEANASQITLDDLLACRPAGAAGRALALTAVSVGRHEYTTHPGVQLVAVRHTADERRGVREAFTGRERPRVEARGVLRRDVDDRRRRVHPGDRLLDGDPDRRGVEA